MADSTLQHHLINQFLLEHLKNDIRERPMTFEDMKNRIAGRIIL